LTAYTTRDVAELIGLPVSSVRSWVRSGILSPERGPRGEFRFSFRDLVLLKAIRELLEADISPRQLRRSLDSLRAELPSGRPLTSVRIMADGERVVVRDGSTMWEPRSRQFRIDFEVSELAEQVAPIALRAAEDRIREGDLDADDWFDLGVDLEIVAPVEAANAYRRALKLDRAHVEAHLNLGRLVHETGDVLAAAEHYRLALKAAPDSAIAAFNRGVALDDLGEEETAIELYSRAIRLDPSHAEAHYNLARLYDRAGRSEQALRHLSDYRRLRGH
jgi:tetratricopeptide (TPR) repeat protein